MKSKSETNSKHTWVISQRRKLNWDNEIYKMMKSEKSKGHKSEDNTEERGKMSITENINIKRIV